MSKFIVTSIFILAACSSAYAEELRLFDIKSFCRMPVSVAKKNLPVAIEMFEIEKTENPKYGHEEVWSIQDEKALKNLGLTTLKIEIHQSQVQSVLFKIANEELSDTEAFTNNLRRSGLEVGDLEKLMSEHRVNSAEGFPIRILGSGDYYQCFEYHAGH
ncbi:MAG: hypothetical protein ABFS18_14495 [Thermodesulfobacteriota bacterium]